MKNNPFGNFDRRLQLLTAVGILSVAVGCGRSPDSALQDDTDLSETTDLFTAAPASTPVSAQDMNRVLATVNGAGITQNDLMIEFNMLASRMQGRVPPERMAQMQEEMIQGAMDNLIIKQLLIQQVEKQGIEVTDSEVDETIAMYRQQMPPGTTIEQQLAQINMSEADFRANIARDLSVNKLLEEKVGNLPEPSEEEIVAFHEQHKADYFAMPERVKASHILLTVQPDDDEATHTAAREKLEALREQLIEGADFAEVATAESDCPSSAQGGDLGTFVRGQMVPPFEEAAFSQPIGEVGDIVKTDFGYHIIQVAERHEPGTQPLEESREQISQYLLSQTREQALRTYVEELREDAEIEMTGNP